MNAQEIISHFGMRPHPEGGFFRRTYEAPQILSADEMPCGFMGPRPVSTAILFLLQQGHYSRLHRIRQDELWHFYMGGPLRLACIDTHGYPREVMLGQDILAGQHVQFTIPGGCWFGATPAPGTQFTLVGCTVSPGFDMEDLRLGQPEELTLRYPMAKDCIREFCPPLNDAQREACRRCGDDE